MVNTPLSRAADEQFGFTEDEVHALISYLGKEGGTRLARQWYDGYRFGDAEIYNPWSILSFFSNDCEPGTYWANTSGNDVIRVALAQLDNPALEKLYAIADPGAEVAVRLGMDAVLPDLGIREDALRGILYLSGYVTTDGAARPETRSVKRRTRLPNMEIAALFRDEIFGRFTRIAGDENGLDRFHNALLRGEKDVVSSELEKFLLRSASYLDLKSENSYHMLLLGMCFGIEGYGNPVSNRESGRGHYGIIRIEPVASGSPFESLVPCAGLDILLITIEVKRVRETSDLEKSYALLKGEAGDALLQIAQMAYDDELLLELRRDRIRWGFAFAGKRCVARYEEA